MGVKRAVQLVERTLGENPGEKLYTIGPIIHNRQVIDDLAKRGVIIADSSDDIPEGSTAVIRAHGIPVSLQRELENKKILLKDGTCPNVIASRKLVEKYSSSGYKIYIAGDENHGEIKCLAGSALNCEVLLSSEQAAAASPPEKSILISQTTLKQEEFDSICAILKTVNPKLIIKNTICRATELRQKAVSDLVIETDAVIVIGGKNSANTQRLYYTARNSGIPSWHIETVNDIPEEIVRYGTVGITAGASTPDYIIDEVESYLLRL